MSYFYSDTSRESVPTALPDVEVFEDYTATCPQCNAVTHGAVVQYCPSCDNCTRFSTQSPTERGFFYAFGFPGCLWDSDPVGPFETEEEALKDAREVAQ